MKKSALLPSLALVLSTTLPQSLSASEQSVVEQSVVEQSVVEQSAQEAPTLRESMSMAVELLSLDSLQSNMQAATLLTLQQANKREVLLGSLAAQKASNKAVRKYATMLIDHHTKAIAEINSLVKEEMLPTNEVRVANSALSMDEMERMVAQLSMLSDSDFDNAYLNTMIVLHIKNIAQLSGSRMLMADSSAKDLINEILPQLVQHLIDAKNLKEKLTYNRIFN